MGKTYHAPGKASQAPAGQAPGKPSTPSGRAPGKNVPRAFGPRTGETLTTHLRSTHWGGIMARAFGPSTLDNLPHASATRPGQTTRWGKTCRAPSGHALGRNMPHADGPRTKESMPHAFRHAKSKRATRLQVTRQRKHAARLPVARWEAYATRLRATRRGKVYHTLSANAPWATYLHPRATRQVARVFRPSALETL